MCVCEMRARDVQGACEGVRARGGLQVLTALAAGFLLGLSLSVLPSPAPRLPVTTPTASALIQSVSTPDSSSLTPTPTPGSTPHTHASRQTSTSIASATTTTTTSVVTTPTSTSATTTPTSATATHAATARSQEPPRPSRTCYGTVAQHLAERVRVLCLVVTYPAHHRSHALVIHHTWGRRCSKVLFITNTFSRNKTDEEKLLPLLPVPDAVEGRDGLWNKTRAAFRHAYHHYRNDFDWFVKADDDTYIIMENLRFWLHDKIPDEPHYYGCHFNTIVPKGYMSGGAGYVLSRGALAAFMRIGLSNTTLAHSQGAEDVQMGFFMSAAGVLPGDSRDEQGRPRFHPFIPGHMVFPKAKDPNYWYWKNLAHDHDQGMECCSPSTISFHYVTESLLYTLEFLIYRLRVFGADVPLGAC